MCSCSVARAIVDFDNDKLSALTRSSFERCAPLLLFLTLPPLGRLLTGRGVLLAHDDWTSDLLHQQLP
jgi:hypothetical protein